MRSPSWPDFIEMTRLGWHSVNPPYKQDGGRYWPDGTGNPEYYFHAEDDLNNWGKPWLDQRIIFRKRQDEVTQ